MTTTLLTLGKPNLNGRTYMPDVIQEAINKYPKDKPILVLDSFDDNAFRFGTANIEKTVGEVKNIRIEGDLLLGDVRVFEGKEIHHLSCRPSFIGKVSKDGVVTEAELLAFAFTNDPA